MNKQRISILLVIVAVMGALAISAYVAKTDYDNCHSAEGYTGTVKPSLNDVYSLAAV
jgi:hypothetical protein